jgi:hypothetical protein
VLLVLVGGVLAARAYEDWRSLQRPPAVRLEDTSRIRPWMTVRFIARSFRVPLPELAAQLGAPPEGNVTLAQLARERRVPPSQEVDTARRAVDDLRAATPAPLPLTGAPAP